MKYFQSTDVKRTTATMWVSCLFDYEAFLQSGEPSIMRKTYSIEIAPENVSF
jgi:hypothetical protein